MAEAKIQIRADGSDAAVADIAKISKGIEGLAERAKLAARGDLINGVVDGIGKVGDALGTSNPALKEFLGTAEEIGKSLARDGVVGAGFNAWGISIAHVTKELAAENAELEAMRKIRADTLAFDAKEIENTKAKVAAMQDAATLRAQAERAGVSVEVLKSLREQAIATQAIGDTERAVNQARAQWMATAAGSDASDRNKAAYDQAQSTRALAIEQERLAIATTADAIEKQREADKKKRDDESKARRKESADQSKRIAEDAATHANQILIAAEKAEREHNQRLRESADEREAEANEREIRIEKETRDRAAALAKEDDERQAVARQLASDESTRKKQESATAQQEIVSAQIDADIAKQEQFNAAADAAGQASLGVLKDIVTGQGDVTKAALESKAKQAGVEAAFATGTGLLMTAIGNVPGATSAFASAAQFGAIALTAGAASLAASAAAPAAGGASTGQGRASSGGGGSGGGGSTNITVVLPQSGRLYPMNDELLRGVRAANREASRR